MRQNGFIQIIIIIILIIVIISLLGISLKEIFSKLSENPSVGENFSFVTDWMVSAYNSYLAKPIESLFSIFKDYIFNIFPESKSPIQQLQQ